MRLTMLLEINHRQRLILKCCAALLVAMLLFPPFVIHGAYASVGVGFAFILSPPDFRAQVAVAQLLVQWLFVVSIAAIGVALAHGQPDTPTRWTTGRVVHVLLVASRGSAAWVLLFWVAGLLGMAVNSGSYRGIQPLADAGILCTLILMWRVWRAVRATGGEVEQGDASTVSKWWALSFVAWALLASLTVWRYVLGA
jgi:hypothetical protein